MNIETIAECDYSNFVYEMDAGCDGQVYPDPETSDYQIPFPAGTKIQMGLSNCSTSFHGEGSPDQYAFDFDFQEGTSFFASRSGEVVKVINDQASSGGGAGNYVVLDHGDQTFGLYLHSPEGGITAEVGQFIEQGARLGSIGRSGLAGYPHLHFIVVKDQYDYPYKGIPISFKNVSPPTTVLQSYTTYQVCE